MDICCMVYSKALFDSKASTKAPRRLWYSRKLTDKLETPDLPWKWPKGARRLLKLKIHVSNREKVVKIDEFWRFQAFLCTHGAFLIRGSSGLEKICFTTQISIGSYLKHRTSFQSMWIASGAFEKYADTRCKVQNVSKVKNSDRKLKILNSRFFKGARCYSHTLKTCSVFQIASNAYLGCKTIFFESTWPANQKGAVGT